MARFIYLLLKIISFVLVFGYLLNIIIYLFFEFYHKRTKLDVKNLKADVVFFGSSRCYHSIIPNEFEERTGVSTYNMGWDAAWPRDYYAAIKIYLKYNQAPRYIFLQLDMKNEHEEANNIAKQALIKFYSSGIINDYYDDAFRKIIRIPLAASIFNRDFSWREIIKTFYNNKNVSVPNRGYLALEGQMKAEKDKNDETDALTSFHINPWIGKIKEICSERGIRLYIFTVPIYLNDKKKYFLNFNQYGLPYLNYADSLQNEVYYSDKIHLNHQGAQKITGMIANDFNKLRVPE